MKIECRIEKQSQSGGEEGDGEIDTKEKKTNGVNTDGEVGAYFECLFKTT